MPDELEFEKPLLELENRIAELRASEDSLAARDEIAKLEERLARQQQRIYSGLTAWQRTQIARHPKRPHTLDLVNLLLEDWVELHGDRVFGDDKAIVGGLATFDGEPVVVIGHQKGRDTPSGRTPSISSSISSVISSRSTATAVSRKTPRSWRGWRGSTRGRWW
jgi:acetyl-CoA carboxylase carboxyl transferase subunit alpha